MNLGWSPLKKMLTLVIKLINHNVKIILTEKIESEFRAVHIKLKTKLKSATLYKCFIVSIFFFILKMWHIETFSILDFIKCFAENSKLKHLSNAQIVVNGTVVHC